MRFSEPHHVSRTACFFYCRRLGKSRYGTEDRHFGKLVALWDGGQMVGEPVSCGRSLEMSVDVAKRVKSRSRND